MPIDPNPAPPVRKLTPAEMQSRIDDLNAVIHSYRETASSDAERIRSLETALQQAQAHNLPDDDFTRIAADYDALNEKYIQSQGLVQWHQQRKKELEDQLADITERYEKFKSLSDSNYQMYHRHARAVRHLVAALEIVTTDDAVG